jgi:putative ABC transport system permease protein
MKFWTSLTTAFRALLVNKLRSTLTMLGVIIGVGAVITMVAVGSGAQLRVEDRIRRIGSNLIYVITGSVRTRGVRHGSGTRLSLTEDDALAIQREIATVRVASPTVRGNAQVVFGNLNWATSLYGVTPEYFEARDWEIGAGKLFTRTNVNRAAKVALVGQTVVDNLFGDTNPVGQLIRVKKVPFTVVGVLDKKGGSGWGRDQDDAVFIPVSTAKKRVLGVSLANARSVSAIAVKVREVNDVSEAEEKIRVLLRQRHRLRTDQDDDFHIRNLSEILQAQEESSRILTVLLAAIASVSLIVGGIGIMNIMLVSVTERTREIGLRMAMGARSRDILNQFIVEALTLSLIGGGMGIVLGLVGAYGIAYLAGWPTLIQIEPILLSFFFAAVVGVFFGFYPARKASRLDPIEALRHE